MSGKHHVMADVETLGVSTAPVLLSIGAVKFDKDNIIDRFHVGIHAEDCERYGLKIDGSTVMWWLAPEREQARKELLELGRVELFIALDGFATWIKETPEDTLGSLWGKGATYDNVVLKSAYQAAGLEYPFTYKQDECYRTMANRCPDVEYVQIGTAHNGVADAESQATHLQAICRQYGIAL
jgi:hypothetical protein